MQKVGKRGAVELSISTIVIIVLAMAMLILGLVLVRTIFTGATSVASMTTDQLKNQVNTLFGADSKVVVYPDSQRIDVVQGTPTAFGIGVKNLNQGSASATTFSYVVSVSDPDVQKKCGVSSDTIMSYITTGRADTNIPIASGDLYVAKVLFETGSGTPLCTVRFRIDVSSNNQPYATSLMDVTFKAA